MITRLRRLMRTHALIGIPLAATYLLFLHYRSGRRRFLGSIVLGVVSLWLATAAPFSTERSLTTAASYTLTDLGALAGGDGESWASGINDAGQIVGVSTAKSGQYHAFFWQNGTMTDLGAAHEGASNASAINNKGIVVGSTVDANKASHAVLWRNDRIEPLEVGGEVSSAFDVNDAGQITGVLGSGYHYDRNAFLWRNGSRTVLGVFSAYGINQQGEVAGIEANTQFFTAVVYQGGAKQRLATPEYEESAAYAINSKGQVVGYCGEWMNEEAALWDHGKLRRLGKLGDGYAAATALNDRGEVVGTSQIAPEETHAFLWHEGKMQDLNRLLSPHTGWVLASARSINARGQIVGWGRIAGRRRAFLLTPTTR